MASKYRYRCLKSTWGVAVDLTAEWIPLPADLGKAVRIAEDLWLQVEVTWLTGEERQYLSTGLQLVVVPIRNHKPIPGPILVRVLDIWFNPCDYQPEGLACALAGWAAQEFGFPAPALPVTFDPGTHRYRFDFGPAASEPIKHASP
jgi:hypothetical protein